MDIKDLPEYNNEEEAEVAQILSITQSLAAVNKVQAALAQQRSQPSLTECEDCGEDIPLERQQFVPGCTRCIHCQTRAERRAAGY